MWYTLVVWNVPYGAATEGYAVRMARELHRRNPALRLDLLILMCEALRAECEHG